MLELRVEILNLLPQVVQLERVVHDKDLIRLNVIVAREQTIDSVVLVNL